MEKQIANPGQAYSLGASWGNPSVDNAMTSEVVLLINGTSQLLYTGDIVCLDVTGTQAVLAGGAADQTVIGCVGSTAEMSVYPATAPFPTQDSGINMFTRDGNMQPQTGTAWVRAAMGFTAASLTVTYAGAAASDVGKYIYTPYDATNNQNPQVFQIVAVTPGTSYTVVVVSGTVTTGFSGNTGTFTANLGRDLVTRGPGWAPTAGWTSTSTYPPNSSVPVVTRGFGRVNINGVAGTVRGDLISVAGAGVVGARTAAGATTAGQTGSFIATTLEAYAARDTTLTTAGIGGHDSVRALIGAK